MAQRIFGVLLVCAAVGLGIYAFLPQDNVKVPKPLDSFSATVSEDFKFLAQKNKLPAEWGDIQHVAYNFHSEISKALVGRNKFEIPESPAGGHKLEIEFIDVPHEDDANNTIGMILQISLYHIESNNKIWEWGRTYDIEPYMEQITKTLEARRKAAPAQPAAVVSAESAAPLESDEPIEAAAPAPAARKKAPPKKAEPKTETSPGFEEL